MALASADVEAVSAATTPAKARALLVKLARERQTASAERRAQIDAATALIRKAFDPSELRAPTPSSTPVTQPRTPAPSPANRAQPGKKASPAQPGTSRARTTRKAPAPRRARRAGRRVVNEAIGHAEPAGQIALSILGASLAFAVLYAVLRNAGNAPRGRAAIEIAGSGTVSALRRFIEPVDPLAPSKTPTQSAVSAAAKRPSTQPTRTHTAPAAPSQAATAGYAAGQAVGSAIAGALPDSMPTLPNVSSGPLFR